MQTGRATTGRGCQQVSYLLVGGHFPKDDSQATGFEELLNRELFLSSENLGLAIRQFETDLLQSVSFCK